MTDCYNCLTLCMYVCLALAHLHADLVLVPLLSGSQPSGAGEAEEGSA